MLSRNVCFIFMHLIPDLDLLEEVAKAMQKQYHSENSRSKRSMQIRKYFSFIEEFRGLLSPVPFPPLQVSIYIAWLSHSLKYSSIIKLSQCSQFLFKVRRL